MKQRLLIGAILFIIIAAYAALNPPPIPQPIASDRFIKLDASGMPMDIWAGPWACILDQKTGLIWENKTDNENIHDAYWTYSWFNQYPIIKESESLQDASFKGTPNKGDCYFEEERCDTLDLIQRTRTHQLCGLKHWRLPSTEELQSLLDHSVRIGEALIQPAFFPHTKKGDYWTSDFDKDLTGVYQHLKFGALAVNFKDGSVKPIPYQNAAFVRLVTEASKNFNISQP